MNTLRVLFYLARADFYERARRSSFLLILSAVIVMGVLVNNGTLLVDLGSPESTLLGIRYRGEFNSAWIGMMTVMVVNLFLGLFGFYLVSNCIKRDLRTGVGQIIATTPVRRATYLLGKWLSNFAVLAVLVSILAVAAVVMVLVQSRTALDLGALLMPFIAVALPNMALTAALAVFFETVPWLRGALGNVVYFFLWIFSTTFLSLAGRVLPSLQDPMGNNIFSASLTAAARAAFPNETFGGISTGIATGFTRKVFPWSGLDWTPGMVAGQWLWAVLGLGLVLLSAIWFARFDPSREGPRRARRRTEQGDDEMPAAPRIRLPRVALPSLSPLVSRLAQASPFLGVLFAELRMLLNGRPWWWWAVTIGLNISILKSPLSVVTEYLLPFVWLWPLALWSGMGNREHKNNTSQMVFSSASPVRRQLPAAWLAGVLATGLLVIAGAVVFLTNSDLPGLTGWAGAVVFVPTLALALGVFSSGDRMFEVVYVIWWYMGLMQKVAGMDFTTGAPQVYLPAAAGLLLLSAFWRGRQVRG
ncbi:MAG TPA: ABC transporter permease subunit [Anaerolineales bacterium]|nr:ABC transporter permease subunit [Anaerolineales bacterium]